MKEYKSYTFYNKHNNESEWGFWKAMNTKTSSMEVINNQIKTHKSMCARMGMEQKIVEATTIEPN